MKIVQGLSTDTVHTTTKVYQNIYNGQKTLSTLDALGLSMAAILSHSAEPMMLSIVTKTVLDVAIKSLIVYI